MEKVGSLRNKILILLGIFILALAFSAAMPNSEAGTLMTQPEQAQKLGPGESYPDSRFGQPPAQVDTGVSTGYAARAVNEMETSDEADAPVGASPRHGSRSPAGLEFATGPNRAEQPSVPKLAASTEPKFADPMASSRTSQAVARTGVQEVALIASDLGYFPKTVFVSRDVPVRLFVTGSSKNTLCIMMDSFSVRKQVRSQKIEEITFTPNVPGKYRFYCPVNGMEGTMVVKEFASSQPGRDRYADQSDDSVPTAAAAPERREPASFPAKTAE